MINSKEINTSTADRILYAAMEIISESGLKGLSASKLANTVKISKSTVFHYYKKMDDIPSLILERLYNQIINPIQENHYENVGLYLKALGNSSFSANEQHITIYKAFASLYQASMHDDTLQQIVQNCYQKFSLMVFTKLHSLCSNHIEDNTLKTLTDLILMSLDGIGMNYLIHHNQTQAKSAWELFVDLIIEQYNLV